MPIVNNLSAGTGYEPHGHCTQEKDINQSPGQLSTRDQANGSRGHRLPLFQLAENVKVCNNKKDPDQTQTEPTY